ncbi:MAG: class B sortase, partial [Clostridia bacterium]|nr:class B sortase [Clostridia bacterium]
SGAGIPETASGTPDVSAPGSPSAAPKASVSPAPSPVPAGTAEGRLPEIRYPENDPPMLRERFIPLRKKSKYIMGWLRAGDTVDLAVVQKDNEWFLTRDASGRRNANGALFLDERISLRTRPYTLVIYGHNMKSGEMFGRLQHFRDSAYFYRHRMLTFDTIYEDGRYIAFAAGELSLIPGTNHYVDFGALFSTRTESRRQGIAQLRLASDCIGAASVEPEDQLLILVTCTSDDDHRTFLAARRLREGEPEDALLLQEGDGDAS